MKIIKPTKANSSKRTDSNENELINENEFINNVVSKKRVDDKFSSSKSKASSTSKNKRKKPVKLSDSEIEKLTSLENTGNKANVVTNADIDIFSDDDSWETPAFTRSDTSQKAYKEKLAKAYGKIRLRKSVEGEGDEQGGDSSKTVKRAKDPLRPRLKKTKVSDISTEGNAPLVNGKKRRRSELEEPAVKSALEVLIDQEKKEFNIVLASGLRILAIREHSVLEISNKLLDRFEEADIVYAVVEELQNLKYVSDDRFAESFVRARTNKGYGPIKIKAELKNKGVSAVLIQEHLNENSGVWVDSALKQYQKKYKDTPIENYKTWTKRARFLQGRGFTMEHIHCVVPHVDNF